MVSKVRLTKKQFDDKCAELERAQLDQENYSKALKEAKAFGDFKENTELETARDGLHKTETKIAMLTEQIQNCEIVESNSGEKIEIGDCIEVTRLDESGAPIGDTRTFKVAEQGDSVLQAVLSIHCSLGKVILGGKSGDYTIPDNGGISYRVKKVV